MEYQEFQKLAVAAIAGSQEDNGSWLNDDAATCAALEVLVEDVLGPLAVWRQSWIYAYLHRKAASREGYKPRRPSLSLIGSRPSDDDQLSVVSRGMWFGRDRVKKCNLWLSIKWNNLANFLDPDSRLGFYCPDLDQALTAIKSLEPWLLAQLAKYCLFDDRDFYTTGQFVRRRRILVPSIQQLELSAKDDHWVSVSISSDETTAIVSQFLFHPGVFEFLKAGKRSKEAKKLNSLAEKLVSLRAKVMFWLRNRQRSDGSWEGSFAITTHCVGALMTPLESKAAKTAISDIDRMAIARAITWLLSDEVVANWDELRSYQQIDVLLLLKKLSGLRLFDDVFDGLRVTPRRLKCDVFLSYAGCDREFAHALARDLEQIGIRVWFAEWDIDYGDNIVEEIQKALDEATRFLIVLSPGGIERKWVRQELSTAFQNALAGGQAVILPIMFKQCNPPAFLRTKKWLDFTDPGEYRVTFRELARRLKQRKIMRK